VNQQQSPSVSSLFEFTPHACKSALSVLQGQKIHEDFLAYLLTRRLGIAFDENKTETPVWTDVKHFCALEGNPDAPFYRPFASRGSNFWKKANVAGSWSKASLARRPTSLGIFEYQSENQIRLVSGHAVKVFEIFLFETRVDPYALGVFLLKGFGVASTNDFSEDAIILMLRREFDFPSTEEGDSQFQTLFDDGSRMKMTMVDKDYFLPCAGDKTEWLLEDTASSVRRTVEPIKFWTAVELSISIPVASVSPRPGAQASDALVSNNLMQALELFGGAILSGPPGTGKSYFARKQANLLVDGKRDRVRFIQFHPSFQYEDFIEGFVPTDTGFELKIKVFVELCLEASKPENISKKFVLIIDELSRADPARVFGEALTYLEKEKRGEEFQLASGRTVSVPPNLVIIATMNPNDRGVDEVDQAFSRRFAIVIMEPNFTLLEKILLENQVEVALVERIIEFFKFINQHSEENPRLALGHAYFVKVEDLHTLRLAWEYQIRHAIERACFHDHASRVAIQEKWNELFPVLDVEPNLLIAAIPGLEVKSEEYPSDK
jgi:5-methylcytosine-specific restriction enzyme B